MKKRVLIVCQHFWPENFRINDIANYFTEHDVEVDVLCGRPNYPAGKLFDGYTLWNRRKEKYNNANIYRTLEIPRGSNSNIRILINYLSFSFFSIFHIPRLLTKKYDKIFLYQLSPVTMSVAGIIIGKIKRVETVMYVLDLWPENLFSVLQIKNNFLRQVATRVSHWHYRKVDRFIVLSHTMKKRIIEIKGDECLNGITIIPQAPEEIYETPIYDKTLHRRFKDKFTILFTGNISPAQSFDTMIDAALILKTKGYKDIHWIIVGDGMSLKDAKQQVIKNNLQDYFSFEGLHPIENIPRYTELADVLVGCLIKSNLLEATIPAKVMSYIASGKPIVLAMDGEVQDLINNKIKCGYAVNARDYKSLALSIEKLYKLPIKNREDFGQKAKTYHLKYFRRDILIKKLFSFILHKKEVKYV